MIKGLYCCVMIITCACGGGRDAGEARGERQGGTGGAIQEDTTVGDSVIARDTMTQEF